MNPNDVMPGENGHSEGDGFPPLCGSCGAMFLHERDCLVGQAENDAKFEAWARAAQLRSIASMDEETT